jgi:hypothetical protein
MNNVRQSVDGVKQRPQSPPVDEWRSIVSMDSIGRADTPSDPKS